MTLEKNKTIENSVSGKMLEIYELTTGTKTIILVSPAYKFMSHLLMEIHPININ